MEIAISIALAFAISGISQVGKDLSGSPLHRPFWTHRPTFGAMLFVGITWFLRPIPESRSRRRGQLARGVAFGLLSAAVQMTTLATFVFGCISLAQHFFDSRIAAFAASGVLMIVGSFIVLPIISVLMVPVTLLVSIPLDLLFPLKDSPSRENVFWCRTCAHHRRSREYEDLLHGLWRSEVMPRSDKLPCTIPLETADTWRQYFATPQSARTLFPKGCPSFESRA